MSIEGLAALLLIAVALGGWAAWRMHLAKRALEVLQQDIEHAQVAAHEQAARLAALEILRDSSQLAEYAIATGTAVVKEVHRGIADIPFSVLEAIPATAASAKVLRGLHDSISEGVYGALAGLNKAVGKELRRGFDVETVASARVGVERPAKDGRAGASSGVQSLATDGKPDAIAAPTTPSVAEPEALDEDAQPPASPGSRWG